MTKVYGYSRVSTSKQDLELQIDRLKDNGAEVIYSEKYTGTKKDRAELNKLITELQDGDTVLVTKIDRLARSIIDLRELVQTINDKGVKLVFLDNSMTFEPNTNDSMQTLMLNMLGSFAEFERDLIVSRTQEGKQYQKANNPNFKDGRPKRKLTPKYLHAIDLMKTYSMTEVTKMTGISRATLSRIKVQYKAEQEQKEQLNQ